MPARRFRLRSFLAAATLGMAVLAVSVVAGVHVAVDHAVSADARSRAEDWARYFIGTLPDFDRLLQARELDAADTQVVSTAAKVGNVFRFKLYDARGGTILQSNSEDFGKADDNDHVDDEVFDAVRARQPIVSLNDGTRERDMPALYAEAYVPVLAADGQLRAVVETYVDETRTAAFFNTSFNTLALGLGLGIALAFGIPTLAFLLRSKHAVEVENRADFLAHHDSLTRILNRDSFAQALGPLLGSGPPRAVAFLDIDELKTVNALFGHAGGNALLKHTAEVLTTFCRDGELVARAGGDEFLLAIARPTADEVVAALEQMLAAIREPFASNGQRITGRVSAGLYFIDGADNADTALHRADVALYQAKADGKNVLRLFASAAEVEMRERRELEQLLRDAVTFSLFELHYQALLSATDKTCVGFEALLRLRDRSGAPVPPTTFIPVAEDLGLIDQIGKWALEEATRAASGWPPPMFVSVNLSVKQFASGRLLTQVEGALAAAGLPPARLELEVTESLLMENTESVARQLKALRALGISIAMDDFGTGYSSLGYLWQFGFDKLKIDRSFVAALDRDEKKASEILDTIVMLAHKLDMQVTAEGIETAAQAKILEALACDQFQGFLYGRPQPLGDIARGLIESGAAAASAA